MSAARGLEITPEPSRTRILRVPEEAGERTARVAVGDEARDEACRRTTADRAGVRIFESARDLAFALESAVDSSSTSGAAALPVPASRASFPTLTTSCSTMPAGWMRRTSSGSVRRSASARRATFRTSTVARHGRFTPEGATVKALKWWTLPISPDGTRVVAMSDRDAAEIYPSTAVRVFRHLSGMSAACSPACARRHVAFA